MVRKKVEDRRGELLLPKVDIIKEKTVAIKL